MISLDTNVLVRNRVRDDSTQTKRPNALIHRAAVSLRAFGQV